MQDMTLNMRQKLKKMEVIHEGYRRFPYKDTTGHITIGIGYNLTDRGISEEWIEKQFNDDISFFHQQLEKEFEWFSSLNEPRQVALIDMCFMGFKKLLTFKKMFHHLSHHNFKIAAKEILNSKWAMQVGDRAHTIAKMIELGEFLI